MVPFPLVFGGLRLQFARGSEEVRRQPGCFFLFFLWTGTTVVLGGGLVSVFCWQEFKSFAEAYTEKKYSKPNREALTAVLGGILDDVAGEIAQSRLALIFVRDAQ